MSLLGSARDAATALQSWYGADPFAASTGLYSWTDPDVAVDVDKSPAIGQPGAALLKSSGLLDTFQDMLCWWNDANAITALVEYMLAADDRRFLPAVEATFDKAQLGWKPNYTALAVGAVAGGLAGAYVGASLGSAFGPEGAAIGAVIGFIAGAFGGGNAAAHSKPGKTYMTNFINGHYDDEGWWALAWLKAYELHADTRYIAMAVTIFNDMAKGWDNVLGGGIYWEPDKKGPAGQAPYKNAIANELFMAVATQLYLKLSAAPPDWVYFRGHGDNKLWQVTGDGSQQTWLGNNTTSSTPFVTADNWIYFQGTDNKLWKIDINGNNANWLGNNLTSAAPFVSNGWVYFRGHHDNKLWKIDTDGNNLTWLGNKFKTKATPFVTDDGWIYFQGDDNKLWKLDINGNNANWLGGNKTSSTPVAINGWVYFRGTDNKLWKIDTNGQNGTWLGYKTKSTPFVTQDGFIYFQGTDNKLWQTDTDGQNGTWLGNNKTSATPFVSQDGWVYFQGTDNALWRIFHDGTQQSKINNNKTSATPFVSTAGPPAYTPYLTWALNTWAWFSSPATGMFSPSGLVMDSPDNPSAAEPSDAIWSYNQGVILAALADLTKITGDVQYLVRAEQLANDFINNKGSNAQGGVTPGGILMDMTDGAPDQPGYGGVQNRQFKGIFMRNLAYLYQHAQFPAYRDFILTNANSLVTNDANPAGTNQYGSTWSGPYDKADFIRQSAALDLLAAALFVQ